MSDEAKERARSSCPLFLSSNQNATAETLPGGTRVYTTPHHRIGTDSLLLAEFADVRPGWSAIDLGSGCGILLLSLIDRGLAGRATGVELDPEGAELLSAAARENGLPFLESIEGDLRDFRADRLYDLAISNPPYYNSGLLPADGRRAVARHELSCTVGELCHAASRVLKDRGRFCLCYPPARLAELIAALQIRNLAPKRLQFVRKDPGAEPWLVLVDARKAGGTGLSILPDRILPAGQSTTY